MWFSLTLIGPGRMEKADIQPHPTRELMARLGKRMFRLIVLSTKHMIYGSWTG
jgi:hypothetical protein